MTPVSAARLAGRLHLSAMPARKRVIRIERPEFFSPSIKPAPSSPRDFLLFKLLVVLSYLFSLLSLAFVFRSYFLNSLK